MNVDFYSHLGDCVLFGINSWLNAEVLRKSTQTQAIDSNSFIESAIGRRSKHVDQGVTAASALPRLAVLCGIVFTQEVPRRTDRPLPLRDLNNTFILSDLAGEANVVPHRRSYRLVVDGLEAWIALASLTFIENRWPHEVPMMFSVDGESSRP